MGRERNSSCRRSIWPPRNLCQSRKSRAWAASASRQKRSTALFLVRSMMPSRFRFRWAPAELGLAGVIFQIGAKTIAAQHAAEYGSQQTDEYFAATSARYRIHDEPQGDKRPQVTLIAIGPPAGLVHVQHRFIF